MDCIITEKNTAKAMEERVIIVLRLFLQMLRQASFNTTLLLFNPFHILKTEE
jgi:hypothetical protein